ncbi:hypothetical protein B0H10DRAFT_2209673 [Mycena sp. CBHHK59/15]|nr:hypothetical protein B0H10DRAFT_2209673 [Mycena sp. CBHHK59/15]
MFAALAKTLRYLEIDCHTLGRPLKLAHSSPGSSPASTSATLVELTHAVPRFPSTSST